MSYRTVCVLVFGVFGIVVFGFLDVWIIRSLDYGISGFVGCWIFRFLDYWIIVLV